MRSRPVTTIERSAAERSRTQQFQVALGLKSDQWTALAILVIAVPCFSEPPPRCVISQPLRDRVPGAATLSMMGLVMIRKVDFVRWMDVAAV